MFLFSTLFNLSYFYFSHIGMSYWNKHLAFLALIAQNDCRVHFLNVHINIQINEQ